MHGVTTAIVGFIFACVVWPQLVRNRPQFHAGVFLAVLIIAFDALGYVGAASGALRALSYAMVALLQIGAILVLFFSAGGVTPREVLGGMRGAFEVIRRGEEEKEVIIPLTGQSPAAEAKTEPEPEAPAEPAAPSPTPAAPPPRKMDEDDQGPVPLA